MVSSKSAYELWRHDWYIRRIYNIYRGIRHSRTTIDVSYKNALPFLPSFHSLSSARRQNPKNKQRIDIHNLNLLKKYIRSGIVWGYIRINIWMLFLLEGYGKQMCLTCYQYRGIFCENQHCNTIMNVILSTNLF